jgi:hypothetical protein
MLAALENSAFSQWLLGSNSIWAYPTVLTVHTLGMMVLVGRCGDRRATAGIRRGIPLIVADPLPRELDRSVRQR